MRAAYRHAAGCTLTRYNALWKQNNCNLANLMASKAFKNGWRLWPLTSAKKVDNGIIFSNWSIQHFGNELFQDWSMNYWCNKDSNESISRLFTYQEETVAGAFILPFFWDGPAASATFDDRFKPWQWETEGYNSQARQKTGCLRATPVAWFSVFIIKQYFG